MSLNLNDNADRLPTEKLVSFLGFFNFVGEFMATAFIEVSYIFMEKKKKEGKS